MVNWKIFYYGNIYISLLFLTPTICEIFTHPGPNSCVKYLEKIQNFIFFNLCKKLFSNKSIWQLFELWWVLIIFMLRIPFWHFSRLKKLRIFDIGFTPFFATIPICLIFWVRVNFWVPRCWFSKSSWKIEYFSYIRHHHTVNTKKVMAT